MPNRTTNYKVFFDTNTIRGEHFVADGLHKSMQSANKSRLVNIKYLLPEIVKDEWINNYLTLVRAQYSKAENIKDTLTDMKVAGHTIILPETDKLKSMAEKYLKDMQFEFIPTPYDKIDFPSVIQRAVEHLAPFPEKGDKGIKDALIGLTIKSFIEVDQPTNDKSILICRDGKLKEYMEELINDSSQLQIFSSIDQFHSHVELALNNLSQELATEARELFFERDNKSTLWYQESLRERLDSYYNRKFSNAEEAVKYIEKIGSPNIYNSQFSSISFGNINYSFGNSSVQLGEIIFEDRKGQTLHWSMKLFYKKEYYIERDSPIKQLIGAKQKLTHNVVFSIKWTTKLNNELKLESSKLTSIKPIEESKTRDFLGMGNITSSEPGTLYNPAQTLVSGDLKQPDGVTTYHEPTLELQSNLNKLKKLSKPIENISGYSTKLSDLLYSSFNSKHFWEEGEEDEV